MPTIVEALGTATAALNAAVATVLDALASLQAQGQAKVTEVSQLITVFRDRLPAGIGLDPVNGNDANPGTLALPVRTLQRALDLIRVDGSLIFLLDNLTVRRRHTINYSIALVGVTLSGGGGTGFVKYPRTVTFFNEAENSPDAAGLRYPAGFLLSGATFRTDFVDLVVPDVPAAVGETSVLVAVSGVQFAFEFSTVTATTAGGRGVLIRSQAAQISVGFFSSSSGTNANGRLFSGVAAGANPDALWVYDTNVTSA